MRAEILVDGQVMCACMRACMHVCACACMLACVRVCVCDHVWQV